MTEAQIRSIFCDDLRPEIGNKFSIMGIYGGIMNVTSFPYATPKFCVMTFFTSMADAQPQVLDLSISYNGVVIAENLAPEAFIEAAFAEARNNAPPEEPIGEITLALNSALSPLVFEKEGVLRVTARVDGREIKAGQLWVRQAIAQPAEIIDSK